MENEYLSRSIDFIHSLGIPVRHRSIAEDTFLPGILIERGSLVIDPEKLRYPGDILHEAGHIAVVPAADRPELDGSSIAERPERAAEEMMAIAWSFAACKHLDIDPYFVFHEEGYHGGGREIADQFEEGKWFGVPMLQFAGMSAEPRQAAKLGLPAYPIMTKWLRD